MSAIIFLGPTLSLARAREIWDVPDYLPPARQGDLYSAATQKPVAIGIIDGYFKGVPSVRHKEILWAMSMGIHVFGASSMGALRAVELSSFGMRGVGAIQASLSRGEWEDDDEVAVVHAPAEFGYRALSEAMVNIRATVALAVHDGVIDADAAGRLLHHAKSRHYRERSYTRLLADAADDDAIAGKTLHAFRHWLPAGQIDQKAEDAIALLTTMRDTFDELQVPLEVEYVFEQTEAWRQVLERHRHTHPDESVTALAIEEIKLDGSWQAHCHAALGRLALSFSRGWPAEPADATFLTETRDMLRHTHGLWRGADLMTWMHDNGLDEQSFSALLDSEACVQRLASASPALDAAIVSELQVRGEFAAPLARARELHERLASARVADDEATGAVAGQVAAEPTLADLLREQGLDQPPADIDSHARASGFKDLDSLRHALLRRYWARRNTPGNQAE